MMSNQFSAITNVGHDLRDKSDGTNDYTSDGLDLPGASGCRSFIYSKCGRFIGQAVASTLSILSTLDKSQVTLIPDIKVIEMGFSPTGTFVATWERWVKTEDAGIYLATNKRCEPSPES
jgi:hypothetical protein